MPDGGQWLANQTDLHHPRLTASFKGWNKSASRRSTSAIELAFKLLGFFPLLVVQD